MLPSSQSSWVINKTALLKLGLVPSVITNVSRRAQPLSKNKPVHLFSQSKCSLITAAPLGESVHEADASYFFQFDGPSLVEGIPRLHYLYLVKLQLPFDVGVLPLQAGQSGLDVLVSADEGKVGGRVHILRYGRSRPAAILLQSIISSQ